MSIRFLRSLRGSNRPRIGSITLAVLAALYLLVFTNQTFWSKAYGDFASRLALAAFAFGLLALFCAFTITISAKYIIKPLLIFMILSAAAASWFMDNFGTVIDVDMIRNAAQTTTSEAGHLVTPPFALHMFLLGIIPAALIAWVRIEHRPFLAKVRWNLIAIIPLLLVALACGISSARSVAAATRLHKDLIMMLNPFLPVGSAVRYAMASEEDKTIVAAPLGTDARVASEPASGKPRILVIVVGETGRAEDFSLGSYNRQTNPELAKQDITYFPETASCGTSTAVSVPCMFSNLTRHGYSHAAGLAHENLLDVFGHAGIGTEWWDNNTGSKSVADRTRYHSYSDANDPNFCVDHECLDGGMLKDLDSWLSQVKGDNVLVLHQLGSHGPAYYQRYPDDFRHFEPECRTGELGKCSRDEIVNSYDNTVLYTDHFLSSVIDLLKKHQDRMAPAMVYMSDHGESLGEHGLYLHGAPYVVAPSQQTHVPFVLWQGNEVKAGIDQACLARRAAQPASHDNLFDTALGLMSVKTGVYRPELDVLSGCRVGGGQGATS